MRSRRSNKRGGRSSNSDTNRRVRSKPGILTRRLTKEKTPREDGRASSKERQRKSLLAKSLPRRPDGKFAKISPSNGFVSPQNRTSKPKLQGTAPSLRRRRISSRK